ncbi:MAG: hypothetical protein K2G88_01790 [Oscillospiraceae bacterium]|nr:hypothetical protein [Oscillospiraceae bacterium]
MKTCQECAEFVIQIFPEYNIVLQKHFADYGELLGHVFFTDIFFYPEKNIGLLELLESNQNQELIKKYCNLIELFWKEGNADMQNIICVSLLEHIADNQIIWLNFGKYISNDFKRFINTDFLKNNCMVNQITLPYAKKKILRRRKKCK